MIARTNLPRLPLVVLVAALVPVSAGRAAEEPPAKLPIPAAAELIARLDRGHPRLLAKAADFAALKERVGTDATLKAWRQRLAERASRLLTEPPSRYEIPDGLRLLSTSRRVLDRVYTLGLSYWLEGDRRWVERAWSELAAAAQFPDWNPRHFLDTAEMSHAFAIGYDWLYAAWTAEQRAALRAALIEKGLKPAQASYGGARTYGWWSKARHNWNQVCNGGIGLAALAIGDEEPALAGELLHAGLESLQLAMAQFAPDGAWDEGPGYWNYATSYNVALLAGLATALGDDFGLSGLPAFADTGLFPMFLTGPLARTFNYADGGDSAIRAPQMFWLARRFHRPAYAHYQRELAAAHAQDLLWFDPAVAQAPALDLPLDKHFRGVDVASLRSRWADREALFVAFKAGDNKANHSHLDLGAFVLDALGVRWAVDLGADDYNLPGYFGGQRWNYYRLRAEGHNVLVLNPGAEPGQDPAAAASMVRFVSTPARACAIADLSRAYARQARQVQRGVAMLERRAVLVQDEMLADKPAEVWWFLHTPAQATLSDNGALAWLAQGEQRLWVRLLSPAGATFQVMEAEPLPDSPRPERQAKNQGVRKLAVHLAGQTDLRLAVLLVPVRPGEPPPAALPDVRALRDW